MIRPSGRSCAFGEEGESSLCIDIFPIKSYFIFRTIKEILTGV